MAVTPYTNQPQNKGFMAGMLTRALSSLTSVGHPYTSHPTTIEGQYRTTLDKQKRRSTRAGRKAALRREKRSTQHRFFQMLRSLKNSAAFFHARSRHGYIRLPKQPRFKTVAVRDNEHRRQLLSSMSREQIRSLKRKTQHSRYTHALTRSVL